MTWRSYARYFFFADVNKFLFPLCIFLFILAEGIYVVYSRIIAQYDKMKLHSADTTLSNTNDFWLTLGLLLLGYFILGFAKAFILNILVLYSN